MSERGSGEKSQPKKAPTARRASPTKPGDRAPSQRRYGNSGAAGGAAAAAPVPPPGSGPSAPPADDEPDPGEQRAEDAFNAAFDLGEVFATPPVRIDKEEVDGEASRAVAAPGKVSRAEVGAASTVMDEVDLESQDAEAVGNDADAGDDPA